MPPDLHNIPYISMIQNASTPDDISDIPIIGDLYGSANAIIDFYEYGCFPHWTIWVDTLFPALGTAVLQLLDFGLGDILRGYFRPSNLRGVGGLTRVPSRGRPIKQPKGRPRIRKPGVPEIGNEIGKKLPGGEFFASRKVTGLERRFWVIDLGVQRVLWYWLVADITEDFLVNWTTAIMESEACRQESLGSVYATIDDVSPITSELWATFSGWTTESDTTPGLWNSFVGLLTIPPGYKAVISYFAEAYGIDQPIIGAQLRVSTTPGLPTNNGGETPFPVTPPDDPTIPIALMTDVHASANPGFRIGTNGNFTGIRNVVFSATVVLDDEGP